MGTKNSKLDSVLKKLRKLKNLYEGAKAINSENEANAAASVIQNLLIQYNITMEEIGSDDEKQKDVILQEAASGYTYKNIGGKWEKYLVTVLCKWNFCKNFQYGKSYKNLLMFGKQENLETVKWLRGMLSERFVYFSNDRWNEFKEDIRFTIRPISKDKFQREYLMGCVAGLDNKLKEESDKNKVEDKTYFTKVNALVVRNFTAVDEYIKQSNHTIGKGTHSSTNAGAAYHQGFKDGKNTDLHKQVSSGANEQVSKVGILG